MSELGGAHGGRVGRHVVEGTVLNSDASYSARMPYSQTSS